MAENSLSPLRFASPENCRERFEAAWNARPKIAEFLAAAGGDRQSQGRLARELLRVDVNCRRRRGETPAADDYLAQLPEYADIVLDVLSQGAEESSRPVGGTTTLPHVAGTATDAGELPAWSANRFRVISEYAKGGLGVVFRAEDLELRREVALKEIQGGYADDATSRRRFAKEAELTGQLEHPGIVPVYSLAAHPNGRPFYAMRFIRGESLKDAIDANHAKRAEDPAVAAIGLRRLLGRFTQICNAIAYAHSRQVIHRDIKPANVMLGEFGETLVVDWGLAKRLGQADVGADDNDGASTSSDETQAGVVLGTPAYMSPEQARGEIDKVGVASDVFSLGATLFHVLTGRPAVTSKDIEALRKRVASGEFDRPRQVSPWIPRSLEAICLKAMDPRADSRYATAKELADDVERYLADERVSAYRESARERAGRWLRKHPAIASAAAAALVLVAIGAGLTAFQQNSHARALAKQTERAESREDMAIEAVKRFRDAVADNKVLTDSPSLQDLRRTLLEEPLEFFEKLSEELQQGDDTRPEAFERLATSAFELGTTESALGDKKRAIAAFEESLKLFDALARANPAQTYYRQSLARGHNCNGAILRTLGKHDEALAAFRIALDIQEWLVREEPTVIEYQSDLADSASNIGLLLSEAGKPNDALLVYETAIKIQERLARENPTVATYPSRVADIQNNIGLVLRQLGNPVAARSAFVKALDIQMLLAKENPEVTGYQSELASSYRNIGLLQQESGRSDEAFDAYDKALEIRVRITQENPTITKYASELAGDYNNIGALQWRTGKSVEARDSYAKAIDIFERLARENPGAAEYHSGLASSLNNVGVLLERTGRSDEAIESHRKALAILERLARENPADTKCQDDLASSHEHIGKVLFGTGMLVESLAALRDALEIRERLARENSTSVEHQSGLARSHSNFGLALSESGFPAEALSSQDKAIEIFERLARESPTVTEYRNGLAAGWNNSGLALRHTGKQAESLAAYRKACEIQEELATENPTVTEYQSGLAKTFINIGALLCEMGNPDEALAECAKALAMQERLSRENPMVTEYQSDLASCYSNYGAVLYETDRLDEALAAYGKSLIVFERLSRENPAVIEYQFRMGTNRSTIGSVLEKVGKPDEALAEYVESLEIVERLSRENPTVAEYSIRLVAIHNSIGIVLQEAGKMHDAINSHFRALGIADRLARGNPESPDFASSAGATLNNIAMIDLEEKRFEQARDRLVEAIRWQKAAITVEPLRSEFRQFLENHYSNLLAAAVGLGDETLAEMAQQGMRELQATDPQFQAANERLAAILKGQSPQDNAERLVLAQHAYNTGRFAASARLWFDALAADSMRAADRQAQHPYNAACSAALAGTGKGSDAPAPTSEEAAKLRGQAREWLAVDLEAWKRVLELTPPENRTALATTVAQTLDHWHKDTDLAGIRGAAIDELPEAEREPWRELWRSVDQLLESAKQASTPAAQPN